VTELYFPTGVPSWDRD